MPNNHERPGKPVTSGNRESDADCGRGRLAPPVFASRAAVPRPAPRHGCNAASRFTLPHGLAAAIVPRRRGKVCSPSIQSARQGNQPGDSYRSMVHSVGRRWETWPDIKILVSGTYLEIVPTRLSMADFAIRRAHKSALEG